MTEIFRKDYQPLPVEVDTVDLDFNLNEDHCTVKNTMVLRIRAGAAIPDTGLFFNGRNDVTFVSVNLNGTPLTAENFKVAPEGLTLTKAALPSSGSFSLTTVVTIKPQDNTLLEGLYKSSGNYCTQCEAEGFRGITYFFDRPDVMSKYTTRIEADKKLYPVLLSNGNLKSTGDLEGGRHFAFWVDPFPKPCYLFALVAGDLAMKESHFKTCKGRDVTLRIYVQQRNIHKVDFAMDSLHQCMKWDEDTFGLEYDLDLFNIVAVDDFNMGAMENKSLNVFNSRLVLATPESASDFDFERIQGVIGHEYFHNWTGNRVTCRDWFQLTLKEGLTVYRDQEFSSDMNSRAVKRLSVVQALRGGQFAEDRGPMAHPVRPDSYVKMDNFYTATVYNKGAEVVRLYEQVLGKDGFRKGMDLYFQRHDGQAVTCDDFLQAMSAANGNIDLSGISKWYGQAGTPELTITPSYDAANGTFTVQLKQQVPPTRGQTEKVPVLIPIRLGLLGDGGKPIPLKIRGKGDAGVETVLLFQNAEETVVFEGVGATKPVLSALRGFSAPVKCTIVGQTDADLEYILKYDTDSFNRYEAGQVLARKTILSLYKEANFESVGVSPALISAYQAIVNDKAIDGAFKAFALTLPTQAELVDAIPQCDPLRLYEVIRFVNRSLAVGLKAELEAIVNALPEVEPEYKFNSVEVARRALVNKAYSFLCRLEDPAIATQLLKRMRAAKNMTDEVYMLSCLSYPCTAYESARKTALAEFAEKWKNEPLVLLKWFSIIASSDVANNIAAVQEVMASDKFVITNPNSVYSLLGVFSSSAVNFHALDGSGYAFAADNVLKVDKINHQVAARIVGPFTTFKQYDLVRQGLMKGQLQRIVATEGLSENVKEIVSKSLE